MDHLQWCRERMLARGSPLAASLHFAEPAERDRILALRTVVSEIAAVPDTVSDTEVGQRKLAWWRDALREGLPHPAVMALKETGAFERLSRPRLDELIANVTATMDAPRFERLDAAWAHCRALGGPAAALEAEMLCAGDAEAPLWRELGAFAYLVRLARDLALDARNERWFVPLDLQAEYQVSRQHVVEGEVGRAFDGLLRSWLADGLERVADADAGVGEASRRRQRHLLVSHALDRRLTAKLMRRPRRILVAPLRPGHVGNVWCAWRAARAVMRGAAVSRS
jgi:phytoene/squalene synthetase